MTQGPTLGKPNSWKSPGVCTNRKTQNILGDRLVPSRSTTDFEAAHHKLTSEESSGSDKVLSFQTNKILKPQEAYINHQKVLYFVMLLFYCMMSLFFSLSAKAIYSATASAHKKSSNRFIPSTADRVLDAPGLMNDYCNTLYIDLFMQ